MRFQTGFLLLASALLLSAACNPSIVQPIDTGSTSTSAGSGSSTESGGSTGGNGGSGGSTGSGGAACVHSKSAIELGIWSAFQCQGWPIGQAATIDGTFGPSGDGFHVVGATSTVEVSGGLPAIPTGTFVHMTYVCQPGFTYPEGGYVMIENLASFGGMANPTEDGARLWYFAVGGHGELQLPDTFPFSVAHDVVCTEDTGGFTYTVMSTTISGQGFTATAQPGASASFTVGAGPDAGSYVLSSVYWEHVDPDPSGEYDDITNYQIARAP